MSKIRWGVLSTANIGRTQFIPALLRAKNSEIIAIASRGSKAHEVAKEFNIPRAYEDYNALLHDKDVDAVYIPLPNHLHKKWVIEASKQGKHVLCEKPATLTSDEVIEMVQICREQNVKFMEGFMYQFHPQHDRVKEIITSGEIGEVKLIRASHSYYMENRDTNIRMRKEMGGGSLYDVGCYAIHAIRNISHSEPIEVRAHSQIDLVSGIDLSTHGYFDLANGIPAFFDCSFDMVRRQEYEVIGTKGTIRVPFAFRPDFNGHVGLVIVQTTGSTREEKIHGDIFLLEVEHFSNAILNDTHPINSGNSAIYNVRALEACYESIQAGALVKV
ncbi:Gfo/Idh/MocA family oxidoreductase [Bacillus timonensis]|uniref:Gfo/Idh/MocA family oxidoreductase n=1 Tax=Bacillus timonensis TaxID=1033734 RepID=A0A4S3PLY1_9BACI|nr:Gfo/Idh/MocA family oxidoreductase [Bacillus timonensis]THE10510.1 Gfo/Idh/MocA family oxidoreductase [Bacillus timonensis]